MINDGIVEREQTAVAPHADVARPTTLLSAIATAASNPAVDIQKMQSLFDMHERMVKREAEEAFNSAFSRAQAKMPVVAHNASNTQTNSRYAKLAAIVKAITPIYTDEGFAISFNTGDAKDPQDIRILASVMHKGGHSKDYYIDMPPDDKGAKGVVNKTNVHATGSTNSYARRYLTCMIWNITTEDDTDGNKPKMSENIKADWLAAIDEVTDAEAGRERWAEIAAVCTKFGDVPAYQELKDAMAAKLRSLQPKEATK